MPGRRHRGAHPRRICFANPSQEADDGRCVAPPKSRFHAWTRERVASGALATPLRPSARRRVCSAPLPPRSARFAARAQATHGGDDGRLPTRAGPPNSSRGRTSCTVSGLDAKESAESASALAGCPHEGEAGGLPRPSRSSTRHSRRPRAAVEVVERGLDLAGMRRSSGRAYSSVACRPARCSAPAGPHCVVPPNAAVRDVEFAWLTRASHAAFACSLPSRRAAP